jgi:hypothetical protein
MRSNPPIYLETYFISLMILLNSTTSMFAGHSGQLWTQQIITSHPSGSCLCVRKLQLSNSNSICTLCNWPRATRRIASQSGNSVWIRSTTNPIDDAETHGAAQRAFADIGHGIGLGLPASFFEDCLNVGNIRHGQKKAAEKWFPLIFSGGKGLGGQGGEEFGLRGHTEAL